MTAARANHSPETDPIATAKELAGLRSDVDNLSARMSDLGNELRGFIAEIRPLMLNCSGDLERLQRVERLTSSAHERLNTFSIAVAALRDRQNRVAYTATGIALGVQAVGGIIMFLLFTPAGQALLKRWLGV